MDDEYEDWKLLTDDLSGDKIRRNKLQAALAGDDGGADPKKGKKGAKKKKGKWAPSPLSHAHKCFVGPH